MAEPVLTPMARAWLERFTPESWEGFPGYEPEVATAIRQALATIDAANAEIERLRGDANRCDGCGTSEATYKLYYCEPCITPDPDNSGLSQTLAAAQRENEKLRARVAELEGK